MTLDELVNEMHDHLNENDLYVLHYISQHMEQCYNQTVSEIAKTASVSSSGVIRMVQKLGFKGYSEFRYFLKNEMERLQRANVLNTSKIGSSIVLEDVKSTIRLFEENKNVEKVYQLLSQANHIYAYATGYGQSLMLKEFSRCLINVGIHLIIVPGQIELNLIAQTLHSDDLLFIVSLSGNISKIQVYLQTVIMRNVPIVSVTLFSQNELAHIANYSLYYEVSNINSITRLNNSSFGSLMLVLTLLYEGYINYCQKKAVAADTSD